ncbi:FecR family protein [Anabaena catenula]|uniref:FecR domain-containing protein n=1 Tax=Anabaena catenula FACHB-362 TaxID=2692877 RepID=A0ABR8J6T0_9NOST|nr:FecR family protein [Anabaena catenula]MBD2693169.1 FecR domain-containing protein [Anabaena catenula FACHB-362]
MKKRWLLLSVLVIAILTISRVSAQNNFQLRVNRYIEVRRVSGDVTYQNGKTSQSARIGVKLKNVGDSISTGQRSSSMLALDTGIAFVQVAENTKLEIQKLQQTRNGGHITNLQVRSGQVRLKVRPFTHKDSSLQIETPAGIAGVRGTEFGVSVQPTGKTGVATLTGSVSTTAQGQSVYINKGFQSLVIPGEPPSAPLPLRNDTSLNLQVLEEAGNQQARIIGKVDPVNLVIFANQPLTTDRSGKFDITIPMPANRRVAVTVTTPLGKKQDYELVVP